MSNHRIPPKPPYFDTVPEGTCRWCNKEIGLTAKGRVSKSRWHVECVNEYKLLFWPAATRKFVWYRDKGKCNSCGTICTRKGLTKWQMDHKVPLYSDPGNLDLFRLTNCQTLCIECHKSKTAKEATHRAGQRKIMRDKIN